MFDDKQMLPSFFEFILPVFIEGHGYVLKVAMRPEVAADAQSPAVASYSYRPGGHLFCMKNGAAVCVGDANIKFVTGMRLPDAEHKQQRVVGESLPRHTPELSAKPGHPRRVGPAVPVSRPSTLKS